MRQQSLRFALGFHLAIGNRRSQAATMVLKPGESEGGRKTIIGAATNGWFVVKGNDVAVVNGRRILLRPGRLVLIERREQHEIRATGNGSLETLNVYLPPAYRTSDEELPAGRAVK